MVAQSWPQGGGDGNVKRVAEVSSFKCHFQKKTTAFLCTYDAFWSDHFMDH